jgi:hypothetical protein
MKFCFPSAASTPTLSEKFERHFREVEHRRMVKSVIKQEVRAHLTEKLAPRLRSLESQRREAEREFATAQAAGDEYAMERNQYRINQAAGGIAELQSKLGS